MEPLYRKLYDKYTKLKTEKFSELDKINTNQEEKFVHYVLAAEELLQYLKSEKERLLVQNNDLRSEVVSIRLASDEKCAEYQKLSMEEYQKRKTAEELIQHLKNENERLLVQFNDLKNEVASIRAINEERCGKYQKLSNEDNNENLRKRIRHDAFEEEVEIALSYRDRDDSMMRQSANQLSKETSSNGTDVDIQQKECCGRTTDQSGGPRYCLNQSLMECLLGMELSASSQSEGKCISAYHQSSGYSFSLTWVEKKAGEVELLYRVLTLGTLERVAPGWMKGVIKFSTSMIPIFFEKVKRVIKLH